jgi:hypothetical protein
VLHFDWAITSLYLAKRKKGFPSYTPVGLA